MILDVDSNRAVTVSSQMGDDCGSESGWPHGLASLLPLDRTTFAVSSRGYSSPLAPLPIGL